MIADYKQRSDPDRDQKLIEASPTFQPSALILGIVELCAKILQIMRNDFKDYARTFCQLCAPFSIQISINQERK